MDVLADVLALAKVESALLATLNTRAPWGIELPARPGAAFHAVVAGICWFTVDGAPPRQLVPGDLVLLPGGARHALTSEPGTALRRFDEQLKRSLIRPDGELFIDGPGAAARILCAGYGYDADVAHPVLGLLPPVLHVATAQPETGPWIRNVLDLVAHETGGPALTGAATVTVRLLDVLLVHVVRSWLDGGHTVDGDVMPASWLRGLRDPVTARALALLHERPSDDWTVEQLAAEVHVSRATLARRFAEFVGEPPLSYLTSWRIELAARRLRETTLPAAAIAREVGYASEHSFNRAFSRVRGSSPGRYRLSRALARAD